MKNKILVLPILLLLGITFVVAYSGVGSGTVGDPYQITNCTQLQEMEDDTAGNYILTNDINCSDTINWNDGAGFIPISELSGTLDGQGYSITDLWMDYGGDYAALISFIYDGTVISNINLVNVLSAGSNYVGGLVGTSDGGGVIENCNVSGHIEGGNDIGGLIGWADNTVTITNSHSSAEVYGSNNVGGLVGYSDVATISGCSSSNYVEGSSYVGGLVGYTVLGSLIENSHSSAEVYGYLDRIGGLVGFNDAEIENSYATGNVQAGGIYTGGLVGFNQLNGQITQSYATGDVTGTGNYVGGFVGSQSSNIANSISYCYATGNVNGGASSVGGFVGAGKLIYNSYATGNVNGSNNVGGFVGYQNGEVGYSYSIGAVTSTGTTGGFSAYGFHSPLSTANFWNTETSGQATSYGATGLTTSQMQSISSYSAWTILSTTNTINGYYPYISGTTWYIYHVSPGGGGISQSFDVDTSYQPPVTEVPAETPAPIFAAFPGLQNFNLNEWFQGIGDKIKANINQTFPGIQNIKDFNLEEWGQKQIQKIKENFK